ncbi:exosortase/archaeosortase family protein [Blastococcus sp. SYSU D00922]
MTASAQRRWVVVVELLVAVAICLAGYFWASTWFREQEGALAVLVLHLFGVDEVSSIMPGHILMFRGDGEVLDGVVTTSCSSLLTVMGLTALNVAVMRSRRGHALLGLLAAVVAVVIANNVRLTLSALAGLWWGAPAMTLFHDWIGTLWALATTLGGFLVMVAVTLPAAERAEQDVAGRHTARRPSSWARPGLGYRAMQPVDPARSGWSLAGFMHRRVLPRALSRRMAAKREAGRIDYRIGHQPRDERIATIQRLVDDGLGAHTASLLAVATYEDDVEVIDALAEAVAARQWEPVTNDRIAALRLWARGWLLGRRTAEPVAPVEDDETDVVAIAAGMPPVPAARAPRRPQPRSFARPTPEDLS